MAISHLMEQTAEALAEDLEVGVSKNSVRKSMGLATKPNTDLKAETYVDRYGKEFPGFITFNEFKDIYRTHVYFASEVAQKKPFPDDNKLLALFNAIDTENRNRIGRDVFAKFVIHGRPAGTFIDKISNKALKGKDRFLAAIVQEMTQADKSFGSHGVLPLAVFQTIMVDYGLPLTEADRPDMVKQGFFVTDRDKQTLVDYKKLIQKITPEQKRFGGNASALMQAAIVIQKNFRGYIHRKKYKAQKDAELQQLSKEVKVIGSKRADNKKVRESQDKDRAEREKAEKSKRGMSREQ